MDATVDIFVIIFISEFLKKRFKRKCSEIEFKWKMFSREILINGLG